MTPIQALKSFCPTGTAEGELHFLEDAFVTPDDYSEIINPPPGSPRLLVGKKGSGKSILMSILARKSAEASIPALLIKPDDLAIDASPATDMASLKRAAYIALIRAMASKLGAGLNGLVNSEDAKLFSQAVSSGERNPDLLQKLLTPLAGIAKLVAQVDFERFLPKTHKPPTPNLVSAIRSNLLRHDDRIFFLLIDDTDQIASPSDENQLNRIWALILAARRVCELAPSIRVLVTLRSEVWIRITSLGTPGQRDQIDHFRPLVHMLSSSDWHQERILERRLYLAQGNSAPHHTGLVDDLFFAGKDVQIPGTTERRSWRDFIIKSSRERPRDVVQLLLALSDRAVRDGKQRIDSDAVNGALYQYSEERVRDLSVEFEHDCPSLKAIIDAFAKSDWEADTESLRKFLLRIPGIGNVTIRGTRLQPDDAGHMYTLWSFLFETGFMNARVDDSRQTRLFRHIMFRERPDLVSPAQWTEMQKMHWEIHPAYHSYLLKRQQDEKYRQVGVELKRRDARESKRR